MTITETQAAEPKVEYEFKRWVPNAFSEPATTPVQALIYAHALLLDEERWIQGEWYQNHHPEADPEDPFCNNWKVCAAGAVAMVAVGAGRSLTYLKSDWGDDGEYKGQIVCPVPEANQTWDIILEKPEYADAPEGLDVYEQAVQFLRDGANRVSGNRYHSSVPGFNDDHMTTRSDVLRAFAAAIELATKAQVEADVKTRVKARLDSVLAGV